MRILLGILVFLPMLCMAQENLVPNGSFEQFTSCPTTMGQLYSCSHWNYPTGADSDYYNVCSEPDIFPPDTLPRMGVPKNLFGTQPAKEGDAYAGIYAYRAVEVVRDYIQVELTEPLFHRIPYVVSFYVSLAEKSQYAISTLGAHLSIDAISSTDLLPLDVLPQVLQAPLQPIIDTTEWVLITDTVVSSEGGERYLTIGNFSSDAESDPLFFRPNALWNLAYYYIDDVSVIALDSVPSGVGINEMERERAFKVYPNPATETLNIKSTGELVGMRVLDMRGRSVLAESVSGNMLALDIKSIHAGIYILQVTDQEGRRATERFIKTEGMFSRP